MTVTNEILAKRLPDRSYNRPGQYISHTIRSQAMDNENSRRVVRFAQEAILVSTLSSLALNPCRDRRRRIGDHTTLGKTNPTKRLKSGADKRQGNGTSTARRDFRPTGARASNRRIALSPPRHTPIRRRSDLRFIAGSQLCGRGG